MILKIPTEEAYNCANKMWEHLVRNDLYANDDHDFVSDMLGNSQFAKDIGFPYVIVEANYKKLNRRDLREIWKQELGEVEIKC